MPAPLAPTTPLGDAIRSARLDAGFTQAELADALNVRQATVSTWEGGEFLPKPVQVLALGKLIGLDRDLYWDAVDAAARASVDPGPIPGLLGHPNYHPPTPEFAVVS